MASLAITAEDMASQITKLEVRAQRAEEELARVRKELQASRWKAITAQFLMDRLGKEVDEWRTQCQKTE